MEVVSYKKVKSNLYEVVIKDGLSKETYQIYDDIILEYELLIDRTLTKKKLNTIIKENEMLTGYYEALKYIARKMRTEKEVRIFLKKKEYSLYAIDKAVGKLKKDGYLNPKIYVSSYINDAIVLTLDGPLKIKDSLIKLGIDESLINSELEKISEEVFEEKIRKIIEKKKKTNKNSKILFKSKLKSYLIINGYYEEMINSILDNIVIDTSANFIKEANKTWLTLLKKYQGNELKARFRNKMYAKGYSIDDINSFINTKE